jgi:hypothetical protein
MAAQTERYTTAGGATVTWIQDGPLGGLGVWVCHGTGCDAVAYVAVPHEAAEHARHCPCS